MPTVTLTVTPPASTGGAALTGYLLQRRVGSGAWSTLATLASTGTDYADTGTAAGVQYGYRAAAVNAVGIGEFSAEAKVTVPADPTPASEGEFADADFSTADFD